MQKIKFRFIDITGQNEPISYTESEEVLKRKKTTSFTVLKRPCDKGIFQNDKSTVTSIISRHDFILCKVKTVLRLLLQQESIQIQHPTANRAFPASF